MNRPLPIANRRPARKLFHPIEVGYSCGHAPVEDRGAMSEGLKAQVLAECRTKPCPACASEAWVKSVAKQRRTLEEW